MKFKRFTALAVAGATLLITGTAWAAGPPYTVSVGGSSAPGTHAVTAASTGPVKYSIKNNAGTIVNMQCASISGTGTVTSGSSVNPVAKIASTTWSGCRFPGGTLTFTQSGTWNLVGTGSNATPGTETIAGYVGNMTINTHMAMNPAICKFTVTSTANGSFDEATQQVKISETGYTGN